MNSVDPSHSLSSEAEGYSGRNIFNLSNKGHPVNRTRIILPRLTETSRYLLSAARSIFFRTFRSQIKGSKPPFGGKTSNPSTRNVACRTNEGRTPARYNGTSNSDAKLTSETASHRGVSALLFLRSQNTLLDVAESDLSAHDHHILGNDNPTGNADWISLLRLTSHHRDRNRRGQSTTKSNKASGELLLSSGQLALRGLRSSPSFVRLQTRLEITIFRVFLPHPGFEFTPHFQR